MSLVNMPDGKNCHWSICQIVKMSVVKMPDSNNASGKNAKW